MTIRLLPVLGLALALGVSACGDPETSTSTAGGGALAGEIAGAGASSQEAAMQAWIAGFQAQNPDATVSYDPVGSGGGREQFVAGGTAFGGTDSHLEDDELAGAQKRCGGADNLIEIPTYVSPIAMIYNLDGVDSLQLSPETLARIFKQEITDWSDPAIAQDNPGATLPDQRITVVNRSDESGTTENFQQYLAAVAPGVWDFEVDGTWPVKGGEAAEGTSGVVAAVEAGTGAIGYADASQAGDLGKAKVKVGETFVDPTPEAAAKILEESRETDDPGRYVLTYELNRETDAEDTYPIVLASYEIACTVYDDRSQADLVKGLLSYIVSAEGQDAAAKNAGSAPLSDAIRQKIRPALEAIGSAD